MAGFSVVKRGLDPTRDGSGVPSNVVTTTSLQPSRLAQVEPFVTPFTVYVAQAGSDANTGNSPGQAYATLSKAINAIQQAGHPGRIICVTYGGADLTLSAPVAIVQKIWIEASGPSAVAIDRTFSTPNGRSVWDAVVTAGGSTVVSATVAFTNADNGRIVSIYGAGTGGGTYYDFINGNPPNGTTANLTATTTIARNSTTDPMGVKLTVVGDWNRVVTDASMASGGSVITSATASWTSADIGTQVVIAGAGQGGQALRAAIKSVSGTTATVTGAASATITNKRCAIGVNFGDLLTYYAGQGGLRNVIVQDQTSGNNSIGAALKMIADDGGSGAQLTPSDLYFENVRITSTDTAGAWEHIVDADGSWNQSAGPGVRRCCFTGPFFFGSRKAGEQVRLVNAVHWSLVACGCGGSAPLPSTQQGVVILDPQNSGGGRGGTGAQDINFVGFEGDAYAYYSEGWNCTFISDRVNMLFPITGRQVVRLGPTSQYNRIVAPNQSTVGGGITALMADEYDAGSNNYIDTQVLKRVNSKALEAKMPTQLAFECFPRSANMANVTSPSSSGVLLAQALWLPGGRSITKVAVLGGVTALAWGTGWTGQHFIYGLYDPDLNLIAQTADTGGTAVFTSAFQLFSLTSAVTIPRSGICYIGLLINSGTGGTSFVYPTMRVINNTMASALPVLCGVTTATGLTALPNPLGTITGQTIEVYGGAI